MIRVRKLSSHFDPAAFRDTVNELTAPAHPELPESGPGERITASALALVEAPVQVDAQDEELADLLSVEQRILRGELGPNDLVNDGSGWKSICEHVPLADALEEAARRGTVRGAGFGTRLRTVPVLALAIGVIAAVLFLLAAGFGR